MARFTTIQKKVKIPYPLKSYFGSGSNEFENLEIEKKLDTFRAIVSNGFSIYDLSERFRKDREDRYSRENMKDVLCQYIAKLIYDDSSYPHVCAYYKEDTYETVAKELDKFVLNPIEPFEFELMIRERFGIK